MDVAEAQPEGLSADVDESGRAGTGDFSRLREGFWASVSGPSGLVP
jgi:hypothetical protein